MALQADTKELFIPTTGGNAYITLTSTFDCRSAFKVKTSNIEMYRVKPVYGFINPKGNVKIEVLRFMGLGKDEKLVIQWAEVPLEETDATASFKAGAESGEVVVALKSK